MDEPRIQDSRVAVSTKRLEFLKTVAPTPERNVTGLTTYTGLEVETFLNKATYEKPMGFLKVLVRPERRTH